MEHLNLDAQERNTFSTKEHFLTSRGGCVVVMIDALPGIRFCQ